MYPISQVQEPYSVVGYLVSRVPLVDLLQLVHPLNREDSNNEGGMGSHNHSWSAWDVCDGEEIKKPFFFQPLFHSYSKCIYHVEGISFFPYGSVVSTLVKF